jgi:hypothetical protein
MWRNRYEICLWAQFEMCPGHLHADIDNNHLGIVFLRIQEFLSSWSDNTRKAIWSEYWALRLWTTIFWFSLRSFYFAKKFISFWWTGEVVWFCLALRLGISIYPRLVSNSWFSCLSFLSVEIIVVCHNAWIYSFIFDIKVWKLLKKVHIF